MNSKTAKMLVRGFSLAVLLFAACRNVNAVTPAFDIGSPALIDIWVDPVSGSDGADGSSRTQAVRTLQQAWSRIPSQTQLTTGYRLMLVAGIYPQTVSFWRSRWGSLQYPVIIQAADGPGTATISGFTNVYDCRYLYLIEVTITSTQADALHLDSCDHVLLRHVQLAGIGNVFAYQGPQEDLKANQCTNIYVEDSELTGAYGANLDFVAVQYGHIVRNRIHHSTGWCIYVKGGSAGIRIEGNEIYDCGEAGFTAGQGTGFEFMVSPWLHYEAYDIKFVNNVVHDVQAAGIGIFGGYNILMAYNTVYRTGILAYPLFFGHGNRGCNGGTAVCASHQSAGGWGNTAPEGPYIPSRNVYVYNNLIYNPPGYVSQDSQMSVEGPIAPPADSNVPAPSVVDVGLQIRGNAIWNGGARMPLGIEGRGAGCQSANPTCNAAQLRTDNAINAAQPQLINPANGDFRPAPGGGLSAFRLVAIPDFKGGDQAQPPLAPQGDLSNSVPVDRDGVSRQGVDAPGAYALGGGTPSALISLNCTPAFLSGPGSASCTVTLPSAAPSGGLTVSLSSSDPAAAIPALLSVPAGATSASFAASAASILQPLIVQLAATAGNSAATFDLGLGVTAPQILQGGVMNAASGLAGPIAPGEVIAVYGAALGPATAGGAVLNSQRAVAALNSGVQALFDGVAAPLLSVGAKQIDVVAPYSLAGKSSTQFVVQYFSASSAPVSLAVGDVAPGVFTADSSGQGQGAILNQDMTVNSRSNPAHKGSIVALYTTGAGQTDPAGIDGLIAGPPPLPHLIAQVTAQIGGVEADVVYSGAAPTLVAGVTQINLRIPDAAPSGAAVPVSISIGGVASQAGVTLAIQ